MRICSGCLRRYCDDCREARCLHRVTSIVCDTCHHATACATCASVYGGYKAAAHAVTLQVRAPAALGTAAACRPCDAILEKEARSSYVELKPGVVYLYHDPNGSPARDVVVKVLPAIGNAHFQVDLQDEMAGVSGVESYNLLAPEAFDMERPEFAAFPSGLYKLLWEALLQRSAQRQATAISAPLHDAGLVSVPESDDYRRGDRVALGWIATEFSGDSMHEWMSKVATSPELSPWNKTILMLGALRGVLRQLRQLHEAAGIVHNDFRPDNVTTVTPVAETLDAADGWLQLMPEPATAADANRLVNTLVESMLPSSSWRVIDFGRADLLLPTREQRFWQLFTDEEIAVNNLRKNPRRAPRDFLIGSEGLGNLGEAERRRRIQELTSLRKQELLGEQPLIEQERQDLIPTIEAGQVWHLNMLLDGRMQHILGGLKQAALSMARAPPRIFQHTMYNLLREEYTDDVTSDAVGPIVDIIYFMQAFIRHFLDIMSQPGASRSASADELRAAMSRVRRRDANALPPLPSLPSPSPQGRMRKLDFSRFQPQSSSPSPAEHMDLTANESLSPSPGPSSSAGGGSPASRRPSATERLLSAAPGFIKDIAWPAMLAEVTGLLLANRDLYQLDDGDVHDVCEKYFPELWEKLMPYALPPVPLM